VTVVEPDWTAGTYSAGTPIRHPSMGSAPQLHSGRKQAY
jgi:hypothetical protein